MISVSDNDGIFNSHSKMMRLLELHSDQHVQPHQAFKQPIARVNDIWREFSVRRRVIDNFNELLLILVWFCLRSSGLGSTASS
jgi:hypothetical protein